MPNPSAGVPGRRIIVGINYPWGHDSSGNSSYGWDFGPAPYGGDAFWKKGRIENDLNEFKSLGILFVRWFILGDGSNYAIDYADVSRPGLPDLPPGFKEDFEKLLKIFETNQMKLIPSLIDFQFCYKAKREYDNQGRLIAIKGGRSYFLTIPQRTDFLDKVLEILLDVSTKHRNAIYAWELMNEPEPCVVGSKEGDAQNCVPITEGDMVGFIEDGVSRINKKGFQSTVGYRRLSTMNNWKGNTPYLGVKQRQFHFYPSGSESLLKFDRISPPCFIGEFAANTIPGNGNYRWHELGNNDTVYERLHLIEKKDYPCAFVWSAKPKPTNPTDDPHTDWPPQTQSPPAQGTPQYDVWRYTHNQP